MTKVYIANNKVQFDPSGAGSGFALTRKECEDQIKQIENSTRELSPNTVARLAELKEGVELAKRNGL